MADTKPQGGPPPGPDPKEIPGGYNGKILRVNLTEGKTSVEDIDGVFCRKYLGGSGFISYYLLKELKKGVDPLGPDNKIVFAAGPLTGTPVIGAGRNGVGAKSPQSGSIALSEAGEFWGAELKHAGFDAVIVEGKSPKPVYLYIKDGSAEIKDAANLWGKKTKETQAGIRAELGDSKVRCAMIGPGGENMVKYACIANGCYDVAGRGGMGAVMGSKNLKAVAVRGTGQVKVADPERLKALVKQLSEIIDKSPMANELHAFGTGGAAMVAMEKSGNLPVRNFRDGLFPAVEQITANVMKDTMWDGMDGCYVCPVRCKKRVKFEEPYTVDADYGGPEYETLAAFGSNCGVDNLKSIVKANELCNAYTLDTIATGVTISFAMECFEKGLLTIKDTGGLDLSWGNADAMVKCVELIARREGFGDMLAEGSAAMAKKIGHDSADFAIAVKGVEAGQHEPRVKPSMGLGFMVNPHGADHGLSSHDEAFSNPMAIKPLKAFGLTEPLPTDEMSPRKVAYFRADYLKKEINNCMVTCSFIPLDYNMITEACAAVTGWDTGVIELLRIAERVLTMARAFNVREGFTPDDDKLPKRFFQGKTDGPLKDKPLDEETMEKAKRHYYLLMGWDTETGVPLPEKMEELGIANI